MSTVIGDGFISVGRMGGEAERMSSRAFFALAFRAARAIRATQGEDFDPLHDAAERTKARLDRRAKRQGV